MTSIFISYRREDAAGHAGRLFDRLVARYGDDYVFIDHYDLPPGTDFTTAIESHLQQAAVVLAIIGPRWVEARDAAGQPRLTQRDDFVRRELLSALASAKSIIPVLVGGAKVPMQEQLPPELTALVRLQACELRDSRFDDDLKMLFACLPPPKSVQAQPARRTLELLAGKWLASVRYPWRDEVTETFELELDGEELFGTGTFLTGPHPLEDIELLEDGLRFTLHSEATMGEERRRITHCYRARLAGDVLHVRMQSTGGFSDGPPLKFTAQRASP